MGRRIPPTVLLGPLRHSNNVGHEIPLEVSLRPMSDDGTGVTTARGTTVETCSIVTTAPNAVTSAVHDRMPVILDPDAYNLWLDPGMRSVGAVSDLLKPYDAQLMRSYPVSSRVNFVVNDDETCSAPVQLGTLSDDELKWEPAKLPAVLAQREIQRPAMLGIRPEAPTHFRTRVAEVSAPNWR